MTADIGQIIPGEGEPRGEGLAGAAPAATQQLGLRFTGTGWEYFRIWAVNLALTLITLGIYYPWARVRKLRYFYANTLVDGDALIYHATGVQLFKGMVIAGVVFGVINILGTVWPAFAALSGLAFWLAVPWLWCMAMRFRLRQTSWRGVRLRFTGTAGQAYAALGGGVLMIVLAAGLTLAALSMLAGTEVSMGVRIAVAALGAVAVTLAWSLLVLWTRHYQHRHYAWGNLGVDMAVTLRQVMAISLAGLGVAVLLVVVWLAASALGLGATATSGPANERWTAGVVVGIVVSLYLVFPLLAAYMSARYQNLFWGATRNVQLRFRSHLSPWRYVGLVLLNIVLTAISLGFYWPFAAIAAMRMRVQAMSIDTQLDWASVHAVAAASGGSVGDMEMEGMDFGF